MIGTGTDDTVSPSDGPGEAQIISVAVRHLSDGPRDLSRQVTIAEAEKDNTHAEGPQWWFTHPFSRGGYKRFPESGDAIRGASDGSPTSARRSGS